MSLRGGKVVEIIENTPESIEEFHKRGWGRENIELTWEHIKALLEDKAIALDDGEYTHVFTLKK